MADQCLGEMSLPVGKHPETLEMSSFLHYNLPVRQGAALQAVNQEFVSSTAWDQKRF